jgi:hypothetical protein
MSIPLSIIELEGVIRIKGFIAGCQLARSLLEIGIIPNGLYKVKNKLSCGKMIIGNQNFKVALDKAITDQILVYRVAGYNHVLDASKK